MQNVSKSAYEGATSSEVDEGQNRVKSALLYQLSIVKSALNQDFAGLALARSAIMVVNAECEQISI